jgi:penicillin-binding protein 2
MMIGLGGLLCRLWDIQVLDLNYYTAKLHSSSDVRARIPPVRGDIRDRNGIVLAENRSAFDIELDLPEIVRAYRERHGEVPTLKYQTTIRQMPKLLSEPDIVKIVNADVVPQLDALGLPAVMDPSELERHFRIDTEVPFVLATNADFKTVAEFSEHDIDLPGVHVVMHPIRQYPFGALAAHVLGYVGDPQQISVLPDARQFAFYEPNVEGKAQIEQAMDQELRGTAGARLLGRNLNGAIDKELGEVPPRPGDSVYLTLDARIQFIAEQALRSVGRAGAVVVDPNTGDILAMASVPSFDPNTFIPNIPPAEWRGLIGDPADPLVNRALAAFPPGSTFKLITALAGLRQGLAKAQFTCTGGVTYGDHYFKCWDTHGHGRLNLNEAIKVSCDAYFYQYGNAAGIDAIDVVGALLGLGQAPDLGLNGEDAGIIPGPDWLQAHTPNERWSSAQTANVSIGQGYDLVSPLQLAMAYCAAANGGVAYYPRLVDKIAAFDGRPLPQPPPEVPTAPRVRARLADIGVSPADLEIVRNGFWKVVNDDGGTARRARLPGGIVAGKTGTAQAQRHGKKDTIAWFVGFAPYDRPRYVVCVMVQGGEHGGSVAAPIAARILEQTLAMDKGDYQPQLVALPPARLDNPFQMIAAVNLDRPGAPGGGVQETEPGSASEARTSSDAHRPVKVVVRPAATPPPEHRNFFQRLFHFGAAK